MPAYQAKREHKRSPVREGIRLLTKAGVEYATSEDLSAGGVRIYLDHDLTPGSMIQVQFSLRSAEGKVLEEISSIVKVVRSVKASSGYLIGLQFVDLKEQTRHLIQSLIDAGDGPF